MTTPALFLITVQLSNLKRYEVTSLIDILSTPDKPLFDEVGTVAFFSENCDLVYLPIFDFVGKNNLHINLVVTGDFIDLLATYKPLVLQQLKALVDSGNIRLVADSYYGESLSSMYNFTWWKESINLTILKIKEKLDGYSVEVVFLPQIYRYLPLEQIVWELEISNFLLRHTGRKTSIAKTTLSKLRRFDNHSVEWINNNNDQTINLFYYPNSYFFETNYNLFYMDKLQATKSFSMAFGFQAVTYDTTNTATLSSGFLSKIAENYSINYYNDLQKAVIRLWEYGSTVIMSEYQNNNHKNSERIKDLFTQYAILQNKDFLFYLNPKIYQHKGNLNFTSPYEAFAFMQGRISQLDILLKNKI